MEQELFKRARTPERKQLRRMAILQAASDVLARDGIEATSLNAIARQAGMVKSNIYRYFESREEILLRLMLLDLSNLNDELDRAVTSRKSVDEMAALFSGGFAGQPRLCQFISQLAMTLERNVSGDVLRDIKTGLMEEGQRAAASIKRALPELDEQSCLHAVHILFSLVAGHWPMANPSGELRTLLEEPQFAGFNHDFEGFLNESLVTVFAGLARPDR